MRRATFVVAAVATVGLLLGGCAPTAPTPSNTSDDSELDMTPATVRVGMLTPGLSNSGFNIAMARGYFEDQNITIEVNTFPAGEAQAASLARGDLDVATGGVSAAHYNAVGQGIGAQVVADKGYNSEDFDWTQFVVTQELYDSGIHDMGDVKGLRIATVALLGSQPFALERTLQAHGLEMSDITQVTIPFPDMGPALAGGSVDVIFPTEPSLTTLLDQGNVAIGSPTEGYPVQQQSSIFYSENFLKTPDLGKRWMLAYLQGVRDYNDAFVNPNQVDRDEIIQILLDAGALRDASILDHINFVGLNPDGYVVQDSLEWDLTTFQERGIVENQDIRIEDVVNNSFVDYAISVLGEYAPAE